VSRILTLALLACVALGFEARAQEARSGRRFVVGVSGFAGGGWQPSGLDLGVSGAVGGSSRHSLLLLLRLGSFVDSEASFIGRTTGFFTWLVAGYRRSLADLMMVGTERNPSFLRLEAVLEAGASANFNSPLPQGGAMGTVAALIGLSYGSPERGENAFALLAGPAWLAGDRAATHAQVSLRFQSGFGGR
jgi:hypothetical protein